MSPETAAREIMALPEACRLGALNAIVNEAVPGETGFAVRLGYNARLVTEITKVCMTTRLPAPWMLPVPA